MKTRKTQKLKAFTLAEILITLSIIGVVAALTIPTLIQRTGNEEYVSRLNKAYSTLSQATEVIITENGSPKTWAVNADSIYNMYRTHLRNSKECGSKSGCWGASYKYLNGNVWGTWDTNTSSAKFVLSDGASVVIEQYHVSPSCTGSYACARISVDVNGKKGPNQYGRDFFDFTLKENGLYPYGCGAENIEDVCSINNNGYGCACRVIQEGAMNY